MEVKLELAATDAKLIADDPSMTCSSTTYSNCGVTDPAPVEVTIDFGDGSGAFTWTSAAPTDIFVHTYTLAGTYEVTAWSES